MLNAKESFTDQFEKPLVVIQFVALIATCGFLSWALSKNVDQTLLAGIFMFAMGMLALINPRVAILVTLVYLAVLGDIRRLMLFYVGPTQYDALLLVGPMIVGILCITIFFHNKLDMNSRLSRLVGILFALMCIEIFNPLQGGLAVGLGGALFYIVPLMWFWVGQNYGTREMLRTVLFRIAVPIAILASMYGFYEVFYEFPDYQKNWIHLIQSSIYVGVGQINRPFAFFTAPQEFGTYCAMASSIVLADAVLGKFRFVMLFAPVLILSCFLQSSRGIVLADLVSLIGIWSLRRRVGEATVSWARVAVLIVVGFGGVIAALTVLSNATALDDRIAPLVAHQTEILDPMHTTAVDHSQLFYTGILSSLVTPAGTGLGSTTIAAAKLEGEGGSTEVDISNMFVSLGPAGGILYLVIVVMLFRVVLRNIRTSETSEGIAVLGLSICLLGQWMNGQMYSLAALVWFCLGSMHKMELDRERNASPLLPAIVRSGSYRKRSLAHS